MSFGGRVTATKIELIKIRRSIQVARMVHKILDDKREVLLKKIDEMIEEANKAREDIWTPLGEIYSSVYDAYMSLGTMTLESISDSTPSIMEVDVNVRRGEKDVADLRCHPTVADRHLAQGLKGE